MGFVKTLGDIIALLLSNDKTKIINVIVTGHQGVLKGLIFPRRRRFPVNYTRHFGDPDKTIKPGSSEMAGLIITVDKEVYEFSTCEQVWEALNYVSTTREDLQFIYDHLQKSLENEPEEFNCGFPHLEEDIDQLWRRGIEVGFVQRKCLQDIKSKSFQDGLIEVQFNPNRKSIVSHKRVEKRQKGKEVCPYCIQEKGREDYPWNGYLISANPYPYYDHHIVLVNSQHLYQFIDRKEVEVMVEFVINAPGYAVVYNGPPGTSILAHMHFQAGRHILPAEKAKTRLIASRGNLRVSELVEFPTRGLVVEKPISTSK